MDAEQQHQFPLSADEIEMADLFEQRPDSTLLLLAKTRLKQGWWNAAEHHAASLLAIKPDNVQAHGILGVAYAITGRRNKAKKELSILAEKKDMSFFPELINAMLSAQKGKLEKAGDYLEKARGKARDHPVVLYYTGSLNLAGGRLDEAEKYFKMVIANYPNFVPALAGLGQLYRQQKKFDLAIKYYNNAVKSQPEVLLYHKQLIDIYTMTGNKKAADEEIKTALHYVPGVKQSYLQGGMKLLSEGSYTEAVKLMDKALGIYRNIPKAFYIKAAALTNLNKSDAALKNIKAFATHQLWSPPAHHYAGLCYLALNRKDDAEQHFKKAVLLNQNMGKSFVCLVVLEQLKGNYQAAIEGLDVAKSGGEPDTLMNYLAANILAARRDMKGYDSKIKNAVGLMPGLGVNASFVIPPKGQEVLFANQRNLMIIFFLNGWYQKAILSSDKLLEINKRDRFAWYYRALAEVSLNQVDSSIKSFKQLLLIEPDLPAAYAGLGQLFLKKHDYRKATAIYKKIIKMDPDSDYAYLTLGDINLQTGDAEKAEKFFNKAIAINPMNSTPYYKLAMMFSGNHDKIDEALKFALKAEEITPDDPIILDVLGWTYVQHGEIQKGLKKLSNAYQNMPQAPIIQYHLGIAYYKSHEWKKAKELLRSATKKSTTFNGYKHAHEILEKISNNNGEGNNK